MRAWNFIRLQNFVLSSNVMGLSNVNGLSNDHDHDDDDNRKGCGPSHETACQPSHCCCWCCAILSLDNLTISNEAIK